jgi:hypothetical protein
VNGDQKCRGDNSIHDNLWKGMKIQAECAH